MCPTDETPPKWKDGTFLAEFARRLEKLHAHMKALDPEWSWRRLAKATGEEPAHIREFRTAKRRVTAAFVLRLVAVVRKCDGALEILLGESDGQQRRQKPATSRRSRLLATGMPMEEYLRARFRKRRFHP